MLHLQQELFKNQNQISYICLKRAIPLRIISSRLGYQILIQRMVNLLSGSILESNRYPNSHRWDSLVRKHYQAYQELIDSQTYRIQRMQRGILALPYPKYYNTELLTLQLFQKKQEVGEVDQNQVDLYKGIEPDIAKHFNNTFNAKFQLPYLGLAVGGSLLAYSTYFNFSIPTRMVLTAMPIAIDWLASTRDAKNEHKTLSFLNWVVGYRKAKCFAEVHRSDFQSQETKKVLGDKNLIELGGQLINMARK